MTAAPPLNFHLARTFWHLVAHRCEIANDRDFLRLDWPLGDLTICNDDGDIVAFDNICPHRGTRFFLADAGNAPVTCPYHGWTYRNRRLRVPKPESFLPNEIAGACLNTYRTEWCGDFLFAGIAPKATLTEQLGTLYDTLARISRDIVRRHDLNRSDWKCDWRIAVENALEPDHVSLIHPKSLGTLGLAKGKNTYIAENSIWNSEVGNESIVRGLKALRRLFDIDYQYEGYESIFVFPFAIISSTFGYSYSLQNFLPSSTSNGTHFVSRLLRARTQSSAPDKATSSFFDSVAKMNRQVFDEDYEICRRISSVYDLDSPERIFSDSEGKARHFHDSLRALAGGAGK